MKSKIKVSVCVVTYNQENYISQCLQSLVEQKTDFKFEVIVGDDCSTDDTRSIIKKYHNKYPEIIKPIFRNSNVGAGENYNSTHNMALGEYIAHIDGDDYALPGKLQNQSDFLDRNPKCNIVWHPMHILLQDGTIKKSSENKDMLLGRKFYKKDILQLMAIGGNSSKMYRKEVKNFVLPDFELLDYFANVEQVSDGYATLSSGSSLGVYRAGIGVSSSGSKTRVLLAKSFLYFADRYPEYRLNINTAALIYLLADGKNFRPTFWLFLKTFCLTFHPCSFWVLYKSINDILLIKK